MLEKVSTKIVEKRLRVSQIFNKRGERVGDGILNPIKHIEDGIWIQLMDEFSLSDKADALDPSQMQVHLGGTRQAFEELGTVLLALARFRTMSASYSLQFDWKLVKSTGTVHFIVHTPVADPRRKNEFPKVHTVAKAIISKDGKTVIESTPRKSRKKR